MKDGEMNGDTKILMITLKAPSQPDMSSVQAAKGGKNNPATRNNNG